MEILYCMLATFRPEIFAVISKTFDVFNVLIKESVRKMNKFAGFGVLNFSVSAPILIQVFGLRRYLKTVEIA